MKVKICPLLLLTAMLPAFAAAQQSYGMQALVQALHDHSLGGTGPISYPPQQMLQGIDQTTLANLAQASALLQRNPNNVYALILRGASAINAAHESQNSRYAWYFFSAKDLERAIHLDPGNWLAHHNYAEVCIEAPDFSPDHQDMVLAILHFSKAISLSPPSAHKLVARSYMGRGWAYLMLNDVGRANADFQKALSIDPSLQTELVSEARAIRAKSAQLSNAQRTLRSMGNYTVDPMIHNQQECNATHAAWINGQCRTVDLR